MRVREVIIDVSFSLLRDVTWRNYLQWVFSPAASDLRWRVGHEHDLRRSSFGPTGTQKKKSHNPRVSEVEGREGREERERRPGISRVNTTAKDRAVYEYYRKR